MSDRHDGQGHAGPDDDGDLAQKIDDASRAADLIGQDAGFTRFGRAVNLVAEVAGVAVFATILGLVFFNAFSRYAFSYTLIWGDEIVISLLPWLGMLGMFLSIRRRNIIRIDFFAARLPLVLQRLLSVAVSVFAAAAFLWLALAAMEMIGFFGKDRTIYLRIQKGWFMAALAAGPALAAAAYLVLAWEDLTGRRRILDR